VVLALAAGAVEVMVVAQVVAMAAAEVMVAVLVATVATETVGTVEGSGKRPGTPQEL